jgi:hypothetical protein
MDDKVPVICPECSSPDVLGTRLGTRIYIDRHPNTDPKTMGRYPNCRGSCFEVGEESVKKAEAA